MQIRPGYSGAAFVIGNGSGSGTPMTALFSKAIDFAWKRAVKRQETQLTFIITAIQIDRRTSGPGRPFKVYSLTLPRLSSAPNMQKSRPGPIGTSCLSCKRRRKKCDQRRPTCERCEVGDFECLGYDHINPIITRVARPMRPLLPRPVENANHSSSELLNETEVSGGSSSRNTRTKNTVLTPSHMHEPPGSLCISPRSRTKTHILDQASVSDFASSHTQSTDRLRLCPTQAPGGPISILQKMANMYIRSPKSLSDPFKFLDDQWFVQFIVAQSERVMSYWYFKPLRADDYKEQLQLKISGRLNNTKSTRWIFLTVTGVIESFATGDMSHVQLYESWIEYIEGSLRAELGLELTPSEMRNRWFEWVHVSLIKIMLFNNLNTHQALRKIASVFLQVIYSSPTLWPADSDLTRVPLSNILVSASHELAYFTLVDCTYAMVSGLPQQVEYDTTVHSCVPPLSRYQLTHGFPTELLLVLAL
ncbi:unnamed protein product [Rhizoctonia solani]|uniref:Zn(2)-C6 fungal-type domain-containing protein n=1 Tax=Rhizoctonia solani TaxID=456999 RepID=A0A8H3C728_9AGAM|nr:unnamed protein product [Rhizoctonia solani]